jgi:nucleoside-diphosphate-sugar epimerase
LYYDVNVEGTQNILDAMDKNGIQDIIFTSSVAIYGLNKENPDEDHPADPFNHYGKSKRQAEQKLQEWYPESTGQAPKINPFLLFVQPLFLGKKTEVMCTICLSRLCPESL